MKRMTVFTKPNGYRFAIAAFDVHRVYQQPEPGGCVIYYPAYDDGEYKEASEIVVGTFDAIMAQIEESNK